jgi:ABC-type branched-subunit amino acid transport system substrate-binding protein
MGVRGRHAAALALALATIISTTTACGSDDDDEQSSATTGASSADTTDDTAPPASDAVTSTEADASTTTSEPEPEPTASDVGVTSEEIRLGFVLIDLEQTTALLGETGPPLDAQQATYQAFVDEVNAAGGVHGRTITPVFTSFDPVVEDATTVCNRLTEDEEVFAVVGNGVFGPPVLCFTQQHGTPLFNVGGFADEYYQQSSGLLFTVQPSKPRSVRNAVAALEQQGSLQGTTIGVLTAAAGDDDVAVETALVPTLESLDHEVAHVTDLSVDGATAIGQIPVAVTEMREAGVDLVFLSTNAFYTSLFVQAADEQGYRPRYALSDADDNIADFFVGRMPDSFEARAFTARRTGEHRVDEPEPELDADCRAVVEQAGGAPVERGSTAYEAAMYACNQIRLFAQAADAAGVELTRAGWASAMQGLGSFELAYADGGSFSETKFDAADFVRPVVADPTCDCWMIDGDFQPMPY